MIAMLPDRSADGNSIEFIGESAVLISYSVIL